MMLQKIIGKIWRVLPNFVRTKIVRTSQSKFTVSVGAVVLNEKGEILLLDHVFRPASGWGIPGGFIDSGEQPHEAIQRELLEETGLELENIEMMRVRTIYRHIEIIFRAEGKGKAEVKSSEIKSLNWFTIDEMPKDMHKGQKEIIKKVLSKTQN